MDSTSRSPSLLRYRSWQGSLHGPWRSVWPIARVSLKMMFRRRLFWGLYALSLLIFFMFFFGQYLLSWAQSQSVVQAQQDVEEKVNIFAIRETPDVIIRQIRDVLKLNGSAEMYRNFFWWQGYMVMIVLAMAGSFLIGNDFRHGSLPFYLSKPLTRWHYLGGKSLAIAVFINLMTTVPALVLFFQYAFLESWRELVGNGTTILGYTLPVNRLIFGIILYGMVLTISLSLLLMAVSVAMRKTVPIIMIWTTLFFFLRLLSRNLVDGLQLSPRWRLIDLWNCTYLVGSWSLGITQHSNRQPAFEEAFWVLCVVSVLCLFYLNRRIRAVEVVQ